MQSIGCAPDLILFNARVYTENPAQPWAQALAVRKHRIMAVGSDAEVLALAGDATHRIDLAGQLVLPAMDEILMMLPPRRSMRIGATAWLHRNAPVRLISSVVRHCASGTSTSGSPV